MSEASQNKEMVVNDFSPGWILKRGTSAFPNAPYVLENAEIELDNSIIGRTGVGHINTQRLTDGLGNANSTVVHSHFLHRSVRYIGVGSVLKRNYDPGVNIITGLSGARITAASMSPSSGTPEQWTYFANGNFGHHGDAAGDCRKTDNGVDTRNWGIDGPESAPTLALGDGQPQTKDIDDFSTAYNVQDGNGTEGAATAPYSTSARSFTVPLTKTERYQKPIFVDLSTLDDTAFIRVMVRVDRVENLDHIELTFDVGDGSFNHDYYQIKIFASSVASDNVWQEMKPRKSEFARVKPTDSSNNTWKDVKALQITVATVATGLTGNLVASFDDMRMEADTHGDGVYDYKMTWWNDAVKIRSNSRSLADVYAIRERISDTINSHRQEIIVTNTATTTDPQVTHWELWRRNRNGGGIFLFVDRVPVGTTTYHDSYEDTALGAELIEDNHIPPPARFVASFDDRMFILGMQSDVALGPTTFSGGGPNNLVTGGHFTGAPEDYRHWTVTIDTVYHTSYVSDHFTITEVGNAGTRSNHGVVIPYGAYQVFDSGITITFGTIGNHEMGDTWSFRVDPIGEEQSEYAVRFSPRFRPESFPITNYFLAGSPADTLRGYALWQGQLWLLTKEHVYRVVSVGNSYVAQITEAPVGTESPYAVSPSPYGIFYVSASDGPYLFNGSTSTPVGSQTIQPFFNGEVITQDGINQAVATPSTVSDYTNVVGQYHNRLYTLVIDDSSGNCRILVYNADKQRWEGTRRGKECTIQRLSSEKAGNDLVAANNLEAGNADGWLLLLHPVFGHPYDPDNESIEVTVQLTFDALLKPQDVEVDIKDILIDINSGGQMVMVEASFDDGPLEIIGAKAAPDRTRLTFPVAGSRGEEAQGRICYKCSVRVVVQQKTFRINLFGIGVNYWPEPRRSNSYSAMWFAPKERGWARRGRFVVRSYAPVLMKLIFDDTRFYEVALDSTNGSRLGFDPTVQTGMIGKVARIIFISDEQFVMYPQSYFEMGTFGSPAQMIPWQLQP